MSRNMKWTTADGRKIAVKDMDDQHLYNTIKFLERHERTHSAIYHVMLEEQTDRRQKKKKKKTNKGKAIGLAPAGPKSREADDWHNQAKNANILFDYCRLNYVWVIPEQMMYYVWPAAKAKQIFKSHKPDIPTLRASIKKYGDPVYVDGKSKLFDAYMISLGRGDSTNHLETYESQVLKHVEKTSVMSQLLKQPFLSEAKFGTTFDPSKSYNYEDFTVSDLGKVVPGDTFRGSEIKEVERITPYDGPEVTIRFKDGKYARYKFMHEDTIYAKPTLIECGEDNWDISSDAVSDMITKNLEEMWAKDAVNHLKRNMGSPLMVLGHKRHKAIETKKPSRKELREQNRQTIKKRKEQLREEKRREKLMRQTKRKENVKAGAVKVHGIVKAIGFGVFTSALWGLIKYVILEML